MAGDCRNADLGPMSTQPQHPHAGIYALPQIYTRRMKHLIDLDEVALEGARAALGTATIKATVNEALRRAASESGREAGITASLDTLALLPLADRADAWR